MAQAPNPDDILQSVMSRESMQEGDEDLQEYMGHIYYLVKDDLALDLLKRDEDTKPLIFALSHLVRTSKMDKDEIKKAKLWWRMSCRIQLLLRKPPSLVNLAKFNSLMIYGNAAIEDTRGGWRGLLVTEKVKTFKIGMAQQRKKGFLGLLGR